MCLRNCCLLKSCCCCRLELSSGVFAWAIIEIILHVMYLALPTLVSDVVPAATYLVPWIVVVFIANVVLVVGVKAQKPALLTLWIIIYVVNVVIMVAALAGAIVFLYMQVGRVFGLNFSFIFFLNIA